MSQVTRLSSDKEKKRPSVSSKCLLNIKSIVSQNVSLNKSSNKSVHLDSPTSVPPPLPLVDLLISAKEPISHSDSTKGNEGQIRDKSRNADVLVEHSQSSDSIKISNEQTPPTNGHSEDRRSKSKTIRSSNCETTKEELQCQTPSVVSKEINLDKSSCQSSGLVNNSESPIIPPLPLNSSMYPFGSSSSPHRVKPLLSFPIQSSNRINEEYVTQLCHIIGTSTLSNGTKSIEEVSVHRHQSIPINRFDLASPTVSTIDNDGDEDDSNIPLKGPVIFVNSLLNLSVNSDTSSPMSDQTLSSKSRLSEPSSKELHQNRKRTELQTNPRGPTSYTRLPHSLRNKNPSFYPPSSPGTAIPPSPMNHFSVRRPFPQFESVRTPEHRSPTSKQASPSTIPAELLNCCQTFISSPTERRDVTQTRSSQRTTTTIEQSFNQSEARSNYFREVAQIREIMINASSRLTQANKNSLSPSIPIVDTHCHFDLIFDRLHIKHNNLDKYFQDYNEYYPPGFSFELAIQVFWRPKHLTEKNWTNWYSKYLDDERVYGSCGIHPHWSSEWNETSAEDIERCLKHPKIVALGEIGLDFGPKNTCLIHEQCRAFEAQLKLAAKWQKPIVIHSRGAYKETFQLMNEYLPSDHKIHLHCFVGTMDDVRLFTSYFTEIKFGFTPIITRTTFLHRVIQELELTQILSETDSPYFTPEELSKLSRCAHPGMVYSVIEVVAQLRRLPVIDVACQLRENARHLYGV